MQNVIILFSSLFIIYLLILFWGIKKKQTLSDKTLKIISLILALMSAALFDVSYKGYCIYQGNKEEKTNQYENGNVVLQQPSMKRVKREVVRAWIEECFEEKHQAKMKNLMYVMGTDRFLRVILEDKLIENNELDVPKKFTDEEIEKLMKNVSFYHKLYI